MLPFLRQRSNKTFVLTRRYLFSRLGQVFSLRRREQKVSSSYGKEKTEHSGGMFRFVLALPVSPVRNKYFRGVKKQSGGLFQAAIENLKT